MSINQTKITTKEEQKKKKINIFYYKTKLTKIHEEITKKGAPIY